MRSDVTIAAAGQTMQSHMITDGKTSYVWMDQQPQGFKMSFSSTNPASNDATGFNPDEKANYNCSPWSPDKSEFALPANVTFTDMNTLMKGQYGPGY